MMRFASLGSGSDGNGLLVESGDTLILLDCGFGLAEVTTRLARAGREPEDIDAIIVTHEHEDHAGGVARLARRHELPVYLTYGTLAALGGERTTLADALLCDGHSSFAIGDIEVQPFPVPHDAREPVQFVLGDGAVRLGVLTDIGAPTPHVVDVLSGLEALVLECNHDRAMLQSGPYPPMLKERIGGPFGHLENAAAARLLGELDVSRLQHVIAAHLSQQNNTPELARAALATVLGCESEWVGVATQEDGFGWRQIL